MPYDLQAGDVATEVTRADGGKTVILVALDRYGADDGTYIVRDRCLEGLTPDGTGIDEKGLTLHEALQAAMALVLCLTDYDEVLEQARSWFVCPDCGPRVKVDDDGCCTTCGADCTIDAASL